MTLTIKSILMGYVGAVDQLKLHALLFNSESVHLAISDNITDPNTYLVDGFNAVIDLVLPDIFMSWWPNPHVE